MKVFLEMVLTNKIDKLIMIAKTDRNVMGIQLLTLLSYDNKSEKGQQAIRKNAFALIRLQKYRYALATFLYADPPMLKEACSVACKQMNDPFLAFLIARLVEHRLGPSARQGGLVLGPCARNVLLNHILPTITEWIKTQSTSNLQQLNESREEGIHLPTFLDAYCGQPIDVSMLGIACTMWLQDIPQFQSLFDMCIRHEIFALKVNSHSSCLGKDITTKAQLAPIFERVYNMTAFCGTIRWFRSLDKHILNTERLEAILYAFQKSISFHGVMHESIETFRLLSHEIESRKIRRNNVTHSDSTLTSWNTNAFKAYSISTLNQWKSWVTSQVDNQISRYGISPTATVSAEKLDDDVTTAMQNLSKMTFFGNDTNSIPETSVDVSYKKNIQASFHFSAVTSTKSIVTQPIVNFYDLQYQRSPVQPVTNAQDIVEMQPPNMKSTANIEDFKSTTTLDIFDMQPNRPKEMLLPKRQSLKSPSSRVDIFDMQSLRPPAMSAAYVESTKSVKSALDLFDMQPQRRSVTSALTRETTSSVSSALDTFDVHPQRSSLNSISASIDYNASASASDIFDMQPQRPSVKSPATVIKREK